MDSIFLEGTNYVSTIRLHNPYFNDKDDKFERNENVDILKRFVVTRTWDFSNDAFNDWRENGDNYCYKQSFSGSKKPTGITLNPADVELAQVNGNLTMTGTSDTQTARWWSAGQVNGEYYFMTPRTDDYLTFTIGNYTNQDGSLKNVKVTVVASTDGSNNRRLRIDNSGSDHTIASSTIQTVEVNLNTTTRGQRITIAPSSNLYVPIRIFKIIVEESYEDKIAPEN